MPRFSRMTPWFLAASRVTCRRVYSMKAPTAPPHPMREEARSLNLAVSVALAAFDALRQFRQEGAGEQ